MPGLLAVKAEAELADVAGQLDVARTADVVACAVRLGTPPVVRVLAQLLTLLEGFVLLVQGLAHQVLDDRLVDLAAALVVRAGHGEHLALLDAVFDILMKAVFAENVVAVEKVYEVLVSGCFADGADLAVLAVLASGLTQQQVQSQGDILDPEG